MSGPKLTVLLPVLNAMPFLPAALGSLETQSDAAFRVLAWDNGSTDGSLECLRQWIPSRLAGEVITEPRLPLGECLAALVERASTEFCVRMDGDDVCLPGRFARQLAALEADPHLALIGGQVETINENGKAHPVVLEYPIGDVDIVHRMLTVTAFAHPAVCLRRSAVLAVGNYRHTTEDYDLWLRLAVRHRLGNLPERVLKYRFHDASISQTGKGPEYRRDYVDAAFARAAAPLYGCDEATLLALRQRRHRCAIGPLVRIARHLERRDGLGMRERFRMGSFAASANLLIGPHDLATRLFLSLFESNPIHACRIARVWIRDFFHWRRNRNEEALP